MKIDVVFRPSDLSPAQCIAQAVVVFDVLRATTTITSAFASGVQKIRIFGSTADALKAKSTANDDVLLCGEERCLPPPGFDLGNSPGSFSRQLHRGKTLYMSTTNGTRAIVAAAQADCLLIGALVNARAVAQRLVQIGSDALLLCAGTNGQIAMEDTLGAGAVIAELPAIASPELSDAAQIALRLFRSTTPSDLPKVLRESAGGRNIIAAGLDADIDFSADLNRFDLVAEVKNLTACLTAYTSADPTAQTTPPADSTPA